MARAFKKLTSRGVESLATPGRHSDGGGLYLVVEPSGSKRWAFIFRWKEKGVSGPGRLREMGLGSQTKVSLADARTKAEAARTLLGRGVDPIAAAKEVREIPTFGAFADEIIDSLEAEWRNPKHKQQWRSTFSNYAAALKDRRVDSITTQDVLAVLQPLWADRPETASRVRGRIERILAAAKAKGFRDGENPATWRNHLDQLLPKRQKLTRGHHAALSYKALPAFMETLGSRDAMAARALEFSILTAARTGETLGATWSEIDLEAETWTVPRGRMKAGKEHRVPLSGPALDLLRKLNDTRQGEFVFPNQAGAGPLSSMAMQMLLRRMDASEITPHGFRSTFRDWASEETSYAREVAEMALAHTISDKVEAAYRRGDLFEKRRNLMADWARYCASPP